MAHGLFNIPFMGFDLIVDANLPKTRLVQVRFPRSKKKRIRRKWAKDRRNFREDDISGTIYAIEPPKWAMIGPGRQIYLMRPEVKAKIVGLIAKGSASS